MICMHAAGKNGSFVDSKTINNRKIPLPSLMIPVLYAQVVESASFIALLFLTKHTAFLVLSVLIYMFYDVLFFPSESNFVYMANKIIELQWNKRDSEPMHEQLCSK